MSDPAASGRRHPYPAWAVPAVAALALLISIITAIVTIVSGSATRDGGQPDQGLASTATCSGTGVAESAMPSVVTLFVTDPTGARSNGSGEFIDDDGHVLTNNHVISAAVGGGNIIVIRPNGEELPATLVGRDPATDLAVVKVTPREPVQPVRFGDVPPIGAQVFAIGAPLGLAETFTSGVVSALGRSVRVPSDGDTTALLVSAIQTDASINPGNSGGMLADCTGDLVGVPTAGATASDSLGSPVAGSIGLGFAVPATTAQRVAETLIADGKVVHGDFGLAVMPVMGTASMLNPSALYITSVTAGGAAALGGLQPGDAITALADEPISRADQLQELSLSHGPGTTVPIEFVRDGRTVKTSIVLG